MAESAKPEKNAETTATVKKKWSLKKKLAVIFGALVIVGVALFLIVNSATSPVAKESDKFLKAIQTSDFNAAYSEFTAEAKASTAESQFAAKLKVAGPILNGPTKKLSKEVKGETGNAATGEVVYEISGTDGNSYKVTIQLQKQNGEWKILNLESKLK